MKTTLKNYTPTHLSTYEIADNMSRSDVQSFRTICNTTFFYKFKARIVFVH